MKSAIAGSAAATAATASSGSMRSARVLSSSGSKLAWCYSQSWLPEQRSETILFALWRIDATFVYNGEQCGPDCRHRVQLRRHADDGDDRASRRASQTDYSPSGKSVGRGQPSGCRGG